MGRRHTKRYETSSSDSESSCSSDSSRSSVSESELDEVECKLTKKIEGLYCKILWNLRREPCLMVNGSDAHASIYSNTIHITPVGGNVEFDLSQYAVNIDYTNGNDFLVVRKNGLYYFSWVATFNEPCILGLFINTVLDTSTVVANNSGATVTASGQLIRLLTGDRIELRNLGLNPITSANPAVNPVHTATNVDFTIFKIAPNLDVCGPFPIPFEKGRCCDNVEKWNCADKNHDGQISACEEKDYHRDHGYECPPPCPPVPCPPTPCDKDDKCEKKFEKLDCNKDSQLSLEEYKKGCEKRKHKHHRHRHHSRDSRRH
jgi:hypothetical protein